MLAGMSIGDCSRDGAATQSAREPVWTDTDFAVWWMLHRDDSETSVGESLHRFVDEMWPYGPSAVAKVIVSETDWVAGELLRDPRTFPEVALGVVPLLDSAYSDVDAENVRILSADNALLPDSIKWDYIRRGETQTIEALVEAGALTRDMMETILVNECSNGGKFARRVVDSFARNPDTHPGVLEKFLGNGSFSWFSPEFHINVRRTVAGNRNVSSAVLRKLVEWGPYSLDFKNIIATVAGNRNADEELLENIYASGGHLPAVRRRLAGNTRTPAAVLDVLADDADLVPIIIGNRNTSVGTVLRLLCNPPKDEERGNYEWWRWFLNPSRSDVVEAAILDCAELYDDAGLTMRCFATKPHIGDAALSRLVEHPDGRVSRIAHGRAMLRDDAEAETRFLMRQAIWGTAWFTGDERTPVAIISEYASMDVAAWENPVCPVETLMRVCVESDDAWWRRRAARVLWRRTVAQEKSSGKVEQ